MQIVGIIAEYNPFHGGHRWQIEAVREKLGTDTGVVAVMSGSFVQRGEPAILHKWARAEAAVLCGVDLVLELPAAFSAATAETFALGGVSLLSAAGAVTHLCFGSESGDLPALQRAAQCLDSPAFHETVKLHLSEGCSYPVARQRAVESLLGEDAEILATANNNLGVEYLRALARTGSAMVPMTVKRIGAGHDSREESIFPSASLVREKILCGEDFSGLLPPESEAILRREMGAGSCPVSLLSCERMILSRLRRLSEEDFLAFDGGGEGLYHRFYRAVQQETSLERILAAVKTKRYPLARLRRMALAAYLDLTPLTPEEVPYLRVLAMNRKGGDILREIRKHGTLPVVTRAADAKKLGEKAEAFFRRESIYTDLYTLGCPVVQPAGWDYTRRPYVAEDMKKG